MLPYLLSALYVALCSVFGWLPGRFLAYYVAELKVGRVATRRYVLRWIGALVALFVLAGSIGEIAKGGYLLDENIKGIGLLAAVICFCAGYISGKRRHKQVIPLQGTEDGQDKIAL